MNKAIEEQSCCHFFESLMHHPSTHPILASLHTKDMQTTLLLFLIWYSTNDFGRIRKRDIQTLRSASESWHNNVVKALSRLANTVDTQQFDDGIIQEAQNLNQFAIKAEMQMLEKTLQLTKKATRSIEQKLNDCCHNIAKYLVCINTQFDHALERKIQTILHACFPQPLHDRLEEQLRKTMQQSNVKIPSVQQQLSLHDL